jgi:streptogramin lyase
VLAAGCGGGGGAQSASIPAPAAPAAPTAPTAPGAVNTLPPSPAPGQTVAATPTPQPSSASAAPAVAQFAAPNQVNAIAVGPDGNIWFTEAQETVGRLTVASGAVATYHGVTASQENCSDPSAPLAQQGSGPLFLGVILTGPNGNVWYTVWCGGPLVYGYSGYNQMNTTGTIVASAPCCAYNSPIVDGATIGSDRNVWETVQTISGYEINNCSYGHALPVLGGIVTGSDAAEWFPANQNGSATIFRTTTSCSLSNPATIAGTTFDFRSVASAGGALWVIDVGKNAIDKITTAGVVTTYAVPKAWAVDSQGNVGYVAAAPSGNYVYFDNTNSAQVGRINVATGAVQEYTLPIAQPQALAVDGSGNVWTFSGATVVKVTFST